MRRFVLGWIAAVAVIAFTVATPVQARTVKKFGEKSVVQKSVQQATSQVAAMPDIPLANMGVQVLPAIYIIDKAAEVGDKVSVTRADMKYQTANGGANQITAQTTGNSGNRHQIKLA